MPFIAMFGLTLIVILLCLWVFTHMGVPSYRPSRAKVEALLQGVVDGYTRREEWELFLGYPIHYDPELEQIRVRCVALEEGDDDHPPFPHGLNGYLYNRAGRARAEHILRSVKLLRSKELEQREF
ncbi:hypothetical protein WH50_14310 [Pokkaliibacter plantistimulans]|uniref:Uncharacterized protein n=2 Tax=Pseudomonadota TaxID=1224 RepID=A0ABX5LYQ0_9GAMM|nr:MULTISPECIES: hypothetical protein [Pokkaliibacter]MDH2433967.1 hypothetical protein [Pokkaliibacter sp. MBI-7]PPC76804.1 hypothetical protein C4K68_13270 [Pokkaliibacter plantistimulans]PXF30608.1 hypothetical protein WH50_14310 [Pokkaliibacter plantistimulans]